jgi:glycosyltransferase involved in cell wall biosynthesis
VKICVAAAYYKPATVYGGPVRSVSALCEGLMTAGDHVTVLTTNANGAEALSVPTGQPCNVDGVSVYYYPRLGSRLAPAYYYSPGLKQACREKIKTVDVVYIVGTWTYAMFAAATAAIKAGVPFVVSPRGSFMTWSMSQKPLKKRVYLELIERRLINRAAAIHCTSSLEQRQLAQWSLCPHCVVIPNGLDLTPFNRLPERGKLRQALGVPQDGMLSLFVGRLHREKRLDLIIEAFATVAGGLPTAHLLIVGPEEDGSGKKALEQVVGLGLSDRVHFAGMLSGMALMHAYADADMLVLLSHRENFAMVVAEAMAAGLPVLASNEVGLATEVVKNGAGHSVDADLEKVVMTWRTMLQNRENLQKMGRHGKALVRRNFSFQVVSAQMLELFRTIF